MQFTGGITVLNHRKLNLAVIIVIVCIISNFAKAVKWEDFWLYDPNSSCVWGLTYAGYSDSFDWNYSVRHNGSHEMLSGEWAAALAWSQGSSSQIYWLTDMFEFPDFSTGTVFEAYGNPSCSAWNNPNNPASDSYDSAYAVIRNTSDQNNIEIRMDYELVDLGQQDANGVGGSPISFRDAIGNIAYVNSERWVLLCTYSVKNLSASTVNDVELYQMICALPTGYDGSYSSYTSDNFDDPLSQYIPYNSVHQTGNFRYDITQYGTGDANTQHVDFICFSSTIPPSAVENGIFCSDGGEPATGTYTNIENRNLNGNLYSVFNNFYYYERVAGAMQFNLGTLAPNETKKITLAVMFGCGPVQHEPPIPDLDVSLSKTDDVGDCILPSTNDANSYINYTITFIANEDVNDVVIVDSLPEYVEFLSCTGGDYNEPNHTITWHLGDCRISDFNGIPIGDVNIFTVRVKVYDDAPQGQSIRNYVRMYSDSNLVTTDYVDTNICCFNTILYVDDDADPCVADGYSWDTAYKTLQNALEHVTPCIGKIFVAAGDYIPTESNDPDPWNKTFQLIDGVDVYGGFIGCESEPNQRNLADTSLASILTGDLNNDGGRDVYNVVTAADCKLDGFTIEKSAGRGIYCNETETSISNCVFKNTDTGIRVKDATVNVFNSFMQSNSYGIESSNTALEVVQCTILGNSSVGIKADDAVVLIADSVIGGSSTGIHTGNTTSITIRNCDVNDNGSYGINLLCNNALIERCEIYRNTNAGIQVNSGTSANIINNIIYDNSAIGVEIGGLQNNKTCRLISNLIYGNTQGMYIGNLTHTSTVIEICNNTIVYNDNEGIARSLDTNFCEPNVNSNIIWGSTNSLVGTFTNVNYNCIENYTGGGTGNTSTNPQLDAEYCLTSASTSCIDNGNPNYVSQTNETDITGEFRCLNAARSTLNAVVDKGADEYNPYDLNFDCRINFMDFAELADDWQTAYDIFDVRNMCAYWLMGTDWPGIGGKGAEYAEVIYECPSQMMMQSVSPQLYVGGPSKLAPAPVAGEMKASMAAESISEPVDVNSLLNWLDDVWKTDEAIRESMTEVEYLEFRNAIENSDE
jgi:hypothetical protein